MRSWIFFALFVVSCSKADKISYDTYQGYNSNGELEQCTRCVGGGCPTYNCEVLGDEHQEFLNLCQERGGEIVGLECDCGVGLCSIAL